MIKKIIFFLFLPVFALTQNNSLTYEQANDINHAMTYKNNTVISSYTTKDGFTINVGDTLTIGNAEIDRKNDKYMLKDVFKHIVVGKTKGVTGKEFTYLPHQYAGTKGVVQYIFVKHEKYDGYNPLKNRKEMPLYVNVFIKNPTKERKSIKDFTEALSISRKTIVDIEKALASGELINPNQPLTREEAIKKLKESQDLMELGFLSKEEFEKLRDELTPIILQ